MKKKKEFDPIVTNKDAGRDYFILDRFEAGIVLSGCEVKSLREHKASLAGSFAYLIKDELYLRNCYIAPYLQGGRENVEPLRERKLLLHRSQIHKLKIQSVERGSSLVPLRMYFNERGIAKVELGIGKGKKSYDKRADIKKRAAQRDIDRQVKAKNRG